VIYRAVLDYLEHTHVDSIVEQNTNRARLPAAPTNALDFGILLIQLPRPSLAKSIIRGGTDSLIQSQRASCNPYEIDQRELGAKADYADSPVRSSIDHSGISERLGHSSNQRGGCVPD
jgi:hypothetical protein